MSISFIPSKRPSRQPQAGKKNPSPAPIRLLRKIYKIIYKIRSASDEEEKKLRKVKRIASSGDGGNSPRRKPHQQLDEEPKKSDSSVDTPAKLAVLRRIS